MPHSKAIFRRSAQVLLSAVCLLVPATATAQSPWSVTLTPTLDPLPIGLCAAIHLTVLDASGKDAPRNALGARVTIADFDITMAGNGVVADRIDAFHWVSCACQSAKPASTATVTASYPSRSLPANARVTGVTFQRSATFTISAAKGGTNPRACTADAAPVSATPAAGTLPQPIGVAAVPRTPPAPVPSAPQPTPATTASQPTPATLPQPIGAPAVPRSAPAPASVSAPAAPPVGVALPPGAPPVARAPVPINPSGFTAVQIAPGQVRLSWQAVGGASFYGLFGPGLTAGGEKIVGATTFVATNVPAGSQQWAVGSFIDPGNISTLASAFPRVTLNVTAPVAAAPPAATAPPPPPPATSGHYRIIVDGFRVVNQTFDSVVDADGKGDEVYGAFAVFHFNRKTDQLLDQDLKRTPVLGQTGNALTKALIAGTATPGGGLRNGDTYPSASNQALPLVIWDGFLSDGDDAVIVVPTLWESDGDDSMVTDWFIRERAAAPLFWWDVGLQQALSRLFAHSNTIPIAVPGWVPPGPYGEAHVASDNFMTTFGLTGFGGIISKDRPIGISLRGSGFELPRRALALTREQIEMILAPPPTSGGANQAVSLKQFIDQKNQLGQLANFITADQSSESDPNGSGIPLIDGPGPTLNGNYRLRLHVERVP